MGKSVSKRIPSLDGLRAISIMLVVFSHSYKSVHKYIDFGNLGVRFFFIISAYLITGILFKDVVERKFSIKKFYFKRILRTFPAFYFYLFSVFTLLYFLGLFEWEQLWRAPVYLENYHPRSLWNSNQWFIGHSWSLAVEEQFYLLISFVFFYFNRKRFEAKYLLYIFLTIVVLVPLLRISYMYFVSIPDVFRGSIHRSFETVADSLAVGSLLAIIPFNKILEHKYFIFFRDKLWVILVLVLLISFFNSSFAVELIGLKTRYFYNLFGITIINILLGLLMVNVIAYPKMTVFSRMLNHKILVKIGLLSYSIYLWQQVWLYHWNFSIILKLLGIIVTSYFSYYVIEATFMKRRNKILSNRK